MKQRMYCIYCKAWEKQDSLSSCLLGCRQAYLVTENNMLVPFNGICLFPKSEKELKYYQKMDESEKYLFRTGYLPCPLCEGRGCKECNNKGDNKSYRDISSKHAKIYKIAKEIRKLKNAFITITDHEYRWGYIERLFFQLENDLLIVGNKIENIEKRK